MEPSILQVVPDYPPAISGVGDYASLVAKGLGGRCGMQVINCSPNAETFTPREHITAERRAQSLAQAIKAELLLEERRRATLLLIQYSGYGYAKRGCPRWLCDSIRETRSSFPDLRIATMFHELFAFGPPWRSSFWTHHCQRNAVRKLAQLSDVILTSNSKYGTFLRSVGDTARDVIVLPTCSNVGEPKCAIPFAERRNRMVVFGKGPTKARLYLRYASLMARVVTALNISEILDVGEPTADLPEKIGTIPTAATGVIGPQDVSKLLSTAKYGALFYRADLLGKSGVLASYAAHAVVPIQFGPPRGTHDGLLDGRNYATPRFVLEQRDTTNLAAISTQAKAWYESHNLKRHLDVISEQIPPSA